MIDWGQALQVSGVGFLTVFVVLGILALVLSFISWLMYRILGKKDKKEVKE